MSALLAFDTATAATVVGVLRSGGELVARRDDPPAGARPRHAGRLLRLCDEALAAAGARWSDVARIGVGVGPGTFTGLRIGVATARALGQATGAELVAVGTLSALALAARGAGHPGAALAVLDARRGEAFAAGWSGSGEALSPPAALDPARLAELADPGVGPWLAIGDGAVRFRASLEPALTVPDDDSPLHGVDAGALCRLAAEGPPVAREELVPDYLRLPDAELERRARS